jgi:hypothetical protein
VPAGDRRSVGELLADSDALARLTLLDVSAEQGPAMVRGWGAVVDSAARLWAVLPAGSLAEPRGADPMGRLLAVAQGMGRSVAIGQWPGPGPADDRFAQVVRNLSRAAVLVGRYGGDVKPTTPQVRADIAAARARIMHTLYVGAHGASVALGAHLNDLRARREALARPRRNVPHRPSAEELKAVQAMIRRLGLCEELAAGYVASHPVIPATLGEVKAAPSPARLDTALAGWDIQAHRTLAHDPAATNVVYVARTQALIITAAGVVADAAGTRGEADPAVVARLRPALDAAQVSWTVAAKRWGELTTPAERADPRLLGAAGEVRAAVAAATFDQTGWATPDQIASRVHLGKTLKALNLAVLAAVDVAYLTREISATNTDLTAPARSIQLRAQAEAEAGIDKGESRWVGLDWTTPAQIQANQLIPLPEPARRGLINLASDTIATSHKAVAVAASVDSTRQTHPARPARRPHPAPAAAAQTKHSNPGPKGPGR